MWSWLVVVCLLWVGTLADDMSSPCPEHCRCFSDQDNYNAAKCTAAAVQPYYNKAFPSVQVLNLKPNHRSQSVKLASKMFQRFRNIKMLNLANCSVTSLPDQVFFGLRYISDIDLSYNRIRTIDGIVFKSLPVLQTLLLRGNPLILSDTSIISDSLKELDMGECGLKTIPDGTFAHVNRITHLSLDGNMLQTIYYQSIPSNLKYLNLANNNIVNVPTKVLLSMLHLRRIDLSNNPVNCTCALMLMQDWFSGKAIALENDVICYSPEPYQGMNLNKINENELCKYERHHDRHMNNLRFPVYKAGDSYHVGTEFNALPTYDVLMADQPEPGNTGEAEVMYSNENTRALGTHMENKGKESSKETLENTEGSGSDGDFLIESDEKHSTILDPDDYIRESSEITSEHPESRSSLDSASASNSSVEEENSSKNNSFEIDTPGEIDSHNPTSAQESSTHESEPLTTTEETESSGAGPIIIPDILSSSKATIIDENEILSTTDSPVEESSWESSSPASSTTEADTSPGHVEVELSSSHSELDEAPTTEGLLEISSEPSIIGLPDLDSSKEHEIVSESPISTTTKKTLVEVTEQVVVTVRAHTEGVEHYSELSTEASILNDTEVAGTVIDQGSFNSLSTYLIIAAIAIPIVILIAMACRKRSPRKVRLPQDAESNIGTELQDMDTLLPKNGNAENGVKVVPKANGAANPADSKSPEEVAPVLQEEPEQEVEPPIVEEPPPSRQNGATTPIQKTKAKLTVIADSIPKTPVFIHKSYPD